MGNTLGVTAESWLGGWEYDRNISKRAFLSVFDDYTNDKFQSLKFRGVFGGGRGFHAKSAPDDEFDLAAGLSLNHESYSVNLRAAGAHLSCRGIRARSIGATNSFSR